MQHDGSATARLHTGAGELPRTTENTTGESIMAFDEGLAVRLRALLGDLTPGATEKKMFGGLSFLVAGDTGTGPPPRRPHRPATRSSMTADRRRGRSPGLASARQPACGPRTLTSLRPERRDHERLEEPKDQQPTPDRTSRTPRGRSESSTSATPRPACARSDRATERFPDPELPLITTSGRADHRTVLHAAMLPAPGDGAGR